MKDKIKLVIVFVLGIMISVVISVYAATVITGSEVSYSSSTSVITYNGVAAANVQDAIDGTYTAANTLASRVSTLDTRVTSLETVTTTNLTKKLGSGNLVLYKTGKVAEIVIGAYNPGVISSRTVIANIPSGSRPCGEVYGSSSSYVSGVIANSNGDLYIEASRSNVNTYTFLTYLICN